MLLLLYRFSEYVAPISGLSSLILLSREMAGTLGDALAHDSNDGMGGGTTVPVDGGRG